MRISVNEIDVVIGEDEALIKQVQAVTKYLAENHERLGWHRSGATLSTTLPRGLSAELELSKCQLVLRHYDPRLSLRILVESAQIYHLCSKLRLEESQKLAGESARLLEDVCRQLAEGAP